MALRSQTPFGAAVSSQRQGALLRYRYDDRRLLLNIILSKRRIRLLLSLRQPRAAVIVIATNRSGS